MAVLESALTQTQVVNLIGPRQAGKTIPVRELFARGRFLTLSAADGRALCSTSAKGAAASPLKNRQPVPACA